MELFEEFVASIEEPQQRARLVEVLQWVKETFPQLEPVFKWNQPMFTDHGTFIVGFSVSKKHIAFAPERLDGFEEKIKAAGYDHGKKFVRMPWEKPIPYDLLKEFISFNIEDKKNCTTFWRH